MIKTLRVTTIIATVLAPVFLILIVVISVRGDENALNTDSSGIIERFNKTFGKKAKTSRNETSPLVQQAGIFASYLNPPVKKASQARGGRTASRSPAVTPKFKVVATSYYQSDPEKSLALIDEPGKGLNWVRQSSKVGHLLVEQIKDGVVVVKSGGKTFELIAEQKPEASLLEGSSGASAAMLKRTSAYNQPAGIEPAKPGLKRTDLNVMKPKKRAPRMLKKTVLPKGDKTDGGDLKSQELIDRLREIQDNYRSDKIGSELSPKEKAELMEKIISKFKSSRLSAEEAEKLSILGEELEEVWDDPNSSLSAEDKGK